MKKYKLTSIKKEVYGITLFQIQALKDFGNVKKGELGGWIEKEDNLSQNGNAWVSGNARVYGDLKLIGGYFYHYKQKSEKIEKVEVNGDYELLAREPVLDKEAKDEMVSVEISKSTLEALKKEGIKVK